MAVRPIDGNELVDTLKQIVSDYTSHGMYPSAFPIEYAIEIVEKMPTLTPPNEWVSVEERLPEDDVSEHKVQIAVLVLTDREAVKIKNRTYHPARLYYEKFYPGRWDWGTFNDDRITHWMPLPTLPGKDNNVPAKEQNEPLTCEGCDMQGEKITPCESCIRDPRVRDYYTCRPPERQENT